MFTIRDPDHNGPIFGTTAATARRPAPVTQLPYRVGEPAAIGNGHLGGDGPPFFATAYREGAVFEALLADGVDPASIPLVDLRDGRLVTLRQAFDDVGRGSVHVTGVQDDFGTEKAWRRSVDAADVTPNSDRSSPDPEIARRMHVDRLGRDAFRAEGDLCTDMPPPAGPLPYVDVDAVKRAKERIGVDIDVFERHPAVLGRTLGIDRQDGDAVEIMIQRDGRIQLMDGNKILLDDADEGMDFTVEAVAPRP